MSNICIDCNLCCKSNLEIRICEDELHKIQLFDIDMYDRKNGKAFQIPNGGCPNLNSNGMCNIYEDRPNACANFKCFPLRLYEKGHLELSVLQQYIQRVKEGDTKFFNKEFLGLK